MRLSLNVGAHIAPRVAKTGGVVLPSLPSLSLSSYSLTQGEAVTINILGATATSVLTVASGALPTGLTLNSGARTITGTPSGTGTANFAIDETLGGYANSPRRNSFAITVAAVPEVSILATPDTITVAEDASPGTILTTLSVVNGSGTYAWTLTDAGEGFATTLHNIGGNQAELRVNNLNFEAFPEVHVAVLADNGVDAGESIGLTITVTDVFEAPSGNMAPILAALGMI